MELILSCSPTQRVYICIVFLSRVFPLSRVNPKNNDLTREGVRYLACTDQVSDNGAEQSQVAVREGIIVNTNYLGVAEHVLGDKQCAIATGGGGGGGGWTRGGWTALCRC